MKKLNFLIMLILWINLAIAQPPTLPTLFYGKVTDSNHKAMQGIEVTAVWLDINGIEHTSSTVTLSESLAEAMGDISFTGYYFFYVFTLTRNLRW